MSCQWLDIKRRREWTTTATAAGPLTPRPWPVTLCQNIPSILWEIYHNYHPPSTQALISPPAEHLSIWNPPTSPLVVQPRQGKKSACCLGPCWKGNPLQLQQDTEQLAAFVRHRRRWTLVCLARKDLKTQHNSKTSWCNIRTSQDSYHLRQLLRSPHPLPHPACPNLWTFTIKPMWVMADRPTSELIGVILLKKEVNRTRHRVLKH